MDDNRAQTLQALEAFIQTQRELLARQQSDIERLQRLRVDLVEQPSQVLANLSNELNDSAFRLSEQADCRVKLPKDIDWTVFDKADTGPLRTFAQQARDKIAQRNRPYLVQRSELSELQKFVKQARRTIVDPILMRFERMSSSEPESEEEVDPVELKREQERQKIRELKKRQIRSCGLRVPASSISGSMGVFIRHDVEDETMEVDVTLDGEAGFSSSAVAMDVDIPPTPVSGHSTAPARGKMPPSPTTTRVRRPTTKVLSRPNDEEEEIDRPRKKSKSKASVAVPKPVVEDDSLKEGKRSRDSGKPKPETYKQAWSMSEQNLLEQLLEQIPEGEKFRWQKISQAMDGRRTPRQVASRVQKYFEKLKKFGIGVDSGGN